MAELNLARIGNILKVQRIQKGLSIRELSTKSGVASGTISQIETGKTAPTLVSVHTLCESLGFPISALFIDDCDERISFVRNNERDGFVRNVSNDQNITEEFIINGTHEMWGGAVTMPPNTNSGDFYYHDGEEFVYVLEGELTFTLEGNQPYHMVSGDTLYYPNDIGHKWENNSDCDCKFLIVSTSEFEMSEEE